MDRRRFLLTSLAGALAAPLAAGAQEAGKVYRIGYLSAGAPKSHEPLRQAFVRRLSDLGWIESRNLLLEDRWAEGRNDRLPALAAELVQRRVDVIVAVAEPAVLAAKNATSSVPIVMLLVGDPVGSKLVASLARPGGNVTGMTFTPTLTLLGKRLALLKEAVPHTSRVAVLSNPANPSHARELSEVEATARPLKLTLHRFDMLMELAPQIRRLTVLVQSPPHQTQTKGLPILRSAARKRGVEVRESFARVEDGWFIVGSTRGAASGTSWPACTARVGTCR